jgi:transcriptional regulator with XRE-family HTH domain
MRHPKSEEAAAQQIDIHIGRRLKRRRSLMGLSQQKLAVSVGLTFQQIQKYEKGVNRISASRLYQLSHILNVSPAYFFDGIGSVEDATLDSLTPSTATATGMAADNGEDLFARRESLELVRAHYNIPSPLLRRRVLEFVRKLGQDEPHVAPKI